MIGALGWPGHTFPVLSLARALRARGHDVLVETPEQWRGAVEELGLRFGPAEESITFAGLSHGGDRGPTLPEAARSRLPMLGDFRPDVVVSDVLTLAPALAAEAAGVRHATLIPHLYPVSESGMPLYLWGLLPPRTPLGAGAWRAIVALQPAIDVRLRRARRNLNDAREELGLPRLKRLHNAISNEMAMVATFPQLEYPRSWPAHVHVTGPMLVELPEPEIELPEGEDPLVIVHSSTAQDDELSLIGVALEALEGEPVRVVATMSRRGLSWPGPVPENAVVVDWVPYAQVMPQASLVVCSGGHGTVARVLAEGKPALVCPPGADMAENGARVTWAGAGLMLPGRLLRPGPLRLTVRRVVSDPRFAARAGAIAAWGRENDGAARGAALLERYASAGGARAGGER